MTASTQKVTICLFNTLQNGRPLQAAEIEPTAFGLNAMEIRHRQVPRARDTLDFPVVGILDQYLQPFEHVTDHLTHADELKVHKRFQTASIPIQNRPRCR